MLKIKTKESASWLIGAVAGICMLAVTILLHAQWWVVALAAVLTFVLVSLFALWMMIGYVAYKLKPIYSVVFSRDVHTGEIIGELKDKRVENISEELNAWADDNDKEISRLKDENKRIISALERGDGDKGISCARLIDEWINGKEGENDR